MSSESKSFSKPDQEFTQFNNAHMVHVNVGGQRVIKITLKPGWKWSNDCLLYTSPSPRDKRQSRMPSSA